jgi:hypothetical protein
MHTYNIKPQLIETVKTVRQITSWTTKIRVHIPNNIDKAIQDLQDDNSDVKVYTDRSGMQGKIGAAAVLYRNGRMKTNM